MSRQVIREYMVQVTRPGIMTTPFSAEQVIAKVRGIQSTFRVADETDAVTERLLELIKRFPSGGKQIHDTNIVATMLVYDIDTLLTQNVDDLKRFSPLIHLRPLIEHS